MNQELAEKYNIKLKVVKIDKNSTSVKRYIKLANESDTHKKLQKKTKQTSHK